METVGITDYIRVMLALQRWRRCNTVSKFNTPPKNNKILLNVHKTKGAYFQCVNNYYTKFEDKGTKTVGVTNYTI